VKLKHVSSDKALPQNFTADYNCRNCNNLQ